MKKLNFYIVLGITALCTMIISCKKLGNRPKKATNSTVVGYWYGTFINNNGAGANLSILFRSNGTLELYDFYHAPSTTDTTQSLNAPGEYTVKGDTVIFSYAFGAESFTARGIINTSENPAVLSYSFTDPASYSLSGTGRATKQN